jgi:hypothetical protein
LTYSLHLYLNAYFYPLYLSSDHHHCSSKINQFQTSLVSDLVSRLAQQQLRLPFLMELNVFVFILVSWLENCRHAYWFLYCYYIWLYCYSIHCEFRFFLKKNHLDRFSDNSCLDYQFNYQWSRGMSYLIYLN